MSVDYGPLGAAILIAAAAIVLLIVVIRFAIKAFIAWQKTSVERTIFNKIWDSTGMGEKLAEATKGKTEEEQSKGKKIEITLIVVFIVLVFINLKLALLFIGGLCVYAVYKHKQLTADKKDNDKSEGEN